MRSPHKHPLGADSGRTKAILSPILDRLVEASQLEPLVLKAFAGEALPKDTKVGVADFRKEMSLALSGRQHPDPEVKGLDAHLIRELQAAMGDPDEALPGWLSSGAPLGIERDINLSLIHI